MSPDRTTLTDEKLWEQYDRCVDEYRFQVNLNWSRSQYFFVLNVAILAAGIGLLSASAVPTVVPIVVFPIGAATAFLATLINRTQHDYYKNIRDLKEALEARLEIGDFTLRTTRGMGGRRPRIARLITFQNFVLTLLLFADITGFVAAVVDAGRSASRPAGVELAVQVTARADARDRNVPVVLSRNGGVVTSTLARRGSFVALHVAPGDYRLSTFARKLCTTRVAVSAAPLQRVVARCP